VQYDTTVRDLRDFLEYMASPRRHAQADRIVVLFFLGILFILAYALRKEYWKDVK